MFTNGTILRGNFSFVKQKDETVPILPNPVKQGIFIIKSGITADYDGKIGVISVKIQGSVYKMLV